MFSLISSRLICALGEKHMFEAITATFDCNGHIFTAKGKTVISDGWTAYDAHFKNALKLKEPDADSDAGDSDGDGEADSAALPPIAEGQAFDNAAATVTGHFTKPPKPYTEDTLLSSMENAGAEGLPDDAERRGLGTPATRAAVIEKLISSGFITRKGRQLVPTADGDNLIKILPDALKSPALTADWESALARIAKGELSLEDFMQGIEEMARAMVAENPEPAEDHKTLFNTQREIIGTCPRCGGSVFESKKNFHCEKRECQFVMWKSDRFFTDRKKELTKTIAAALLKTGKATVKGFCSEKTGKTCDAAIRLADTGGKYVVFRFDNSSERRAI